MTIRRQYSLPNCTLVLEGLSDNPTTSGGQLDTRPLMTILVTAECYFSGKEQPLRGGRDFFESLVSSVSGYAQEFLSQVHHPQLPGDKPELVVLQKLPAQNLHRLTFAATPQMIPAGMAIGMPPSPFAGMMQETPTQFDLTTVQLFDLVEAIDQFLADGRTLPDLKVSLAPLSKRYRKADEPIAKRAAPAAIGVTGLALSAIALFLVPIPKERQTKSVEKQPDSTKTNSETKTPASQISPSATAKPTPSPPSNSEIESALTSTPEISDPTELNYLELNLRKKLNTAWDVRGKVNENLEYRVSVAKDGAIVGYKPIKDTPRDAAAQTPLPDLLYSPVPGTVAKPEQLAQFRVVFTRTGALQISPWRGRQGKAGLGPQIEDSAKVDELSGKLRQELIDNWKEEPTFPKELIYRIGVTEDGSIANYEPINTPAWDYLQKIPLESLTKPEAAGIGSKETGLIPQKPLAHFKVVFKPSGTLEVSPY